MSQGPQSNVSGAEGSDNEVNLLTLFSLKALFSDKIADFQIESNNNDYGKFGDIILTFIPMVGEQIKIAFQLNHKIIPQFLRKRGLLNEDTKHNHFSIVKCLNSYQQIQVKDKQNCYYVLFSNNQISLNSFNSQGLKCSIVQDNSNISFNFLMNIFNSGKIHKFQSNNDVNQNEFLDRFYLFSDQCKEKEVESEIQKILLQNFGSNEIANTMSLLKLFRDLREGRFTNKKLDKVTLICHLIDKIILPLHSINLKQARTGQDSFCEDFYKAVKLFDATLISCKNMDFLKQNLKHINYVSEKNPFRWAQEYKFIDREMRDTNFQINTHCRILYHIDSQPMVLNYSWDSAKAINCLIKISIKKFPPIKFILAGKESDFDLFKKDPYLKSLNLFENLCSLQMRDVRVYKQLINQFAVEVNGRKLTSLTEFVSFNDQIANNMTPSVIVNSLKTGVIKFDDESTTDLPPHYIPRQLFGDVMSFVNIAQDKSTLFVISCSRQIGKVRDFFKTRNLIPIDFDKIDNKSAINTNIILTTSKRNITKNELHKKIEHKFQKTCYLEVIVENESFLGYFRYRKRKDNDLEKIIVVENEIQKYFQKSIEVVSGTPGMGKTTLMKSIAKKCFPKYFCILITLKDYFNFFKEKHLSMELLNEYFNKKNVSANFQAHLTNYIVQKCKVIFLFDGFDEIDRKCHDNLFKCVEEIRKNGHKVWISTRPNFSELLQNRFDVNDLEIVELNEKTQKEFIKDRLSESKQKSEIDKIITKIYENIIIERHQTLLGTPFLLHMTTEIVINNKDDLLIINNITDLFKYFFKIKFIHHIKKHSSCIFMEDYLNLKLNSYQIPALKWCLETDLFNKLNLYIDTEQVESIRKFDLGIIVNVSGDRDNTSFSFYHNAYAEYFAAKWLALNYTHIKIEDRNFLLDDKYENLKFLFDIFMAEGCPAHIAVLCEDEKRLANCTEDEIVKTDQLNRTVWHIICEYGDKFPSTGISYSDGCCIVDRKVQYFKPKNQYENVYKYINNAYIPLLQRDTLFNRNSLDCATERFSINIFELISRVSKTPRINFHNLCIFSSNRILIIYYSLKFGYVNLLQLDSIRSVLATQTLTYKEKHDYNFSTIKQNSLYLAVKYGQLEVLKYLCTFANLYDPFSDPPLLLAAQQGHLDIVKELIRHNVDVNASDKNGATPLRMATLLGHLDIVQELIAHNADVNAANKDGRTPLLAAALQGHLDIIKELIVHNADVNVSNKDGLTPLLAAVLQGHQDIVKQLIAQNADVNTANKDGLTPLLAAAHQGYLNIVQELIAHNADVNTANKDGLTPFLAAAHQGHLDIVKELIAHNADANRANKDGLTPFLAAAQQGHVDIVKELIPYIQM